MVEFFHGNTLLGTDTTAPFSFTWSGVSAGVYQITAKATDNDGCYAISEPIVIRVDAFLINVDFGAGTGPSTKSGLAGTGQAANDFWNFYTRDDGNGGWLSFGSLPNLKLASGDITSVGMTVDNAPGYWGSGSSDPMYNGYIYPFGGNATITVTDLPVGRYDLYLYGVDTTFQVSAGGVSYGTKTSYDSPVVNPPIWQEGKQFALFKSVAITSPGQTIVISVQPGQAGWAVVSGLQIAPGIRL
jgi:hypothetical protein